MKQSLGTTTTENRQMFEKTKRKKQLPPFNGKKSVAALSERKTKIKKIAEIQNQIRTDATDALKRHRDLHHALTILFHRLPQSKNNCKFK